MCLAQGHNIVTPMRPEPAAPRSRFEYSTCTTEPLCSKKRKNTGSIFFSNNNNIIIMIIKTAISVDRWMDDLARINTV